MAKLLQNLPGMQPFPFDTTETTNLGTKWKLYYQELNLFLAASGITQDTQKRVILLHASGKTLGKYLVLLIILAPLTRKHVRSLIDIFLRKRSLFTKDGFFCNVKQTSEEDCLTYSTQL